MAPHTRFLTVPPWPRSTPGPLADKAVLLADPGLIRKPDFDRRRLRQPFEMSLRARAGSFFKRLDDPPVLSRMTGACAHVGEPELLQKFADIARVEVDAEPLGDDALEINPPPAHDAIFLAIRPSLDDLCELGQLLPRQTRLGTVRPVVDQALVRSVEAMHPVTQRLPIHAADLRRPRPVHPVPNRGQRQKTTALAYRLRPPSQRPKLLGRIILSQSDR